MNKKIYKQAMKKTGDELQEWLQFKHRGLLCKLKREKVLIPASKSIKQKMNNYMGMRSFDGVMRS